jgi:hypothetical protein
MEVNFFPWLHRSLEFKNRLQLFLGHVLLDLWNKLSRPKRMILQGDLQQQCTGCLGGVVEPVMCFWCLILGCCVWLAIQCSRYGKDSLDQSLLPWELIVLLVYPTPLDLHVVFSPWDTSAFLHRLYTRFHNMNPSFFHPSVLSSREFHVLKIISESRTWFCACHWGNKFMNSATPLLTYVTDCHIYYTGYHSILVALILYLLQMLYFSLHPCQWE